LIRQTSRQSVPHKEEITVFRFARRTSPPAGVQFCDSCAKVSTTADRARRRMDRTRAHLTALAGLR
jgi:hypothetical protein